MTSGPQTVLVIDDDPFLRAFAVAVLENAGFATRQADNAVDGVASALTSPPDLILLDFAMPANNGLTVMGALNAIHNADAIPVIVLSAWQSEEVRRQFQALGASWLDKPVTADGLLSAIRRSLRR